MGRQWSEAELKAKKIVRLVLFSNGVDTKPGIEHRRGAVDKMGTNQDKILRLL
jgi:hypothetical protein